VDDRQGRKYVYRDPEGSSEESPCGSRAKTVPLIPLIGCISSMSGIAECLGFGLLQFLSPHD
jgi:hypothetical protein